jgi:hypothetical protein
VTFITGIRVTIGSNVRLNGVEVGLSVMNNYSRNVNNQNEQSSTMSKYVNITKLGTSGDYIEIVVTKIGSNGDANVQTGCAELYISKV